MFPDSQQLLDIKLLQRLISQLLHQLVQVSRQLDSRGGAAVAGHRLHLVAGRIAGDARPHTSFRLPAGNLGDVQVCTGAQGCHQQMAQGEPALSTFRQMVQGVCRIFVQPARQRHDSGVYRQAEKTSP